MKIFSAVAFLVLVAAFFACGEDDSGGDFLDGLPEGESIRIKLPGSESSGSALLAEEDGSGGGMTQKGLGDWAEFYLFTRAMTQQVNGGVYHLLLMIEDIARQEPTTKEENKWIWGPHTPGGLDPASYRVTIEKTGEKDYSWVFDAKAKDAGDDAFSPMMSGTHTKGNRPRRGAGTINLNFDTMAALDPTKVERGTAEVTYQSDTHPVTVTVKFVDFTGEDGKGPTNAQYLYTEQEDGSGEFSFSIEQDMDGKGKIEDARILTRWKSSGTGRSDIKISGGDLADDGVTDVVAVECWDTGFKRTYFEDWANGDIPIDAKQGDASACAFSDRKLPE
ncbi:MAG: hypothetical protein HY897_25875 [Deltaproteobacteria bacterium]|nr:hypothetical protein [Deltaproteobacteria bacterium]